jgi:hypothetical protein
VPAEHIVLMHEAVELEASGQRALLAGDRKDAERDLRAASARYRSSWELAGSGAYGRLVGMLKAAVIAGDATTEAGYARRELAAARESPTASYALAIAALVEGDDAAAAQAALGMHAGGEAFARAADAVGALAARDRRAYDRAVRAIVADFEARDAHLTGVRIADTALMLEHLAETRGMRAGVTGAVLPLV